MSCTYKNITMFHSGADTINKQQQRIIDIKILLRVVLCMKNAAENNLSSSVHYLRIVLQ